MNSDDKIDLTSVNKTKKQFKLPKLKNPFKKNSAGPGRDQFGQFASGSGGLKSAKNFNWKRTAPLVAVVALVGGLFVFRSFAAVGVGGAYQFSVSECSISATKLDTCPPVVKVQSNARTVSKQLSINDSAEALTFRMYKGILNRAPDTAGYKFWVQKLAGDRINPMDMANQLTATKTVASLSTDAYVTALYKQYLKTDAPAKDKSGYDYWVKQINEKKWSRAKVAYQFAVLDRTKTVQTADFQTFAFGSTTGTKLLANRTVEVKQNAKTKQVSRLTTAKNYVAVAKSQYDGTQSNVNAAKPNLETAKSIAAKAKPSRSDLTAIANNEKTAKSWLAKAQTSAKNASITNEKAKKLASEAADVSAYSADISNSEIQSRADKVLVFYASANNNVKSLNTLIASIGSQYKVAEGKYQTEQARLEQARLDALKPDPVTPETPKTPKAHCESGYFYRSADNYCWGGTSREVYSKDCYATYGGSWRTYSTFKRESDGKKGYVCKVRKNPLY